MGNDRRFPPPPLAQLKPLTGSGKPSAAPPGRHAPPPVAQMKPLPGTVTLPAAPPGRPGAAKPVTQMKPVGPPAAGGRVWVPAVTSRIAAPPTAKAGEVAQPYLAAAGRGIARFARYYFRPRTVVCRLIRAFSAAENGQLDVTGAVEAYATNLAPTDRCLYEIAWNAEGAPVGHGGFQAAGNAVQAGVARAWTLDLSANGQAFDVFQNCYFDDDALGRCFYVRDAMNWHGLVPGAQWRFRLRVVNINTLAEQARSAEVTIDWDNPPGQVNPGNAQLYAIFADQN